MGSTYLLKKTNFKRILENILISLKNFVIGYACLYPKKFLNLKKRKALSPNFELSANVLKF